MGTCKACGAPLQQLFVGWACSAECDLKPKPTGRIVKPEQMFGMRLGTRLKVLSTSTTLSSVAVSLGIRYGIRVGSHCTLVDTHRKISIQVLGHDADSYPALTILNSGWEFEILQEPADLRTGRECEYGQF